MAELDQQTKAEVVDYVKKEILIKIPMEIEQLNCRNVEALRGKVHVLRCYFSLKRFDSDITDRLNTILGISQGLWDFLRENITAIDGIRGASKTVWADIGSNLLSLQAILSGESGEEAFNDLIITSISTFLGWVGDIVWVDMAKDELETISRTHLMGIRDELWQFINETIQNGNEMTLEKVAEIGEKMDFLLQFIGSDDMPVAGRVLFISQMYILLLSLNISKILVSLNSQSEKQSQQL